MVAGKVKADFHVLTNELSGLDNITISTFLPSLPLACLVLTQSTDYLNEMMIKYFLKLNTCTLRPSATNVNDGNAYRKRNVSKAQSKEETFKNAVFTHLGNPLKARRFKC